MMIAHSPKNAGKKNAKTRVRIYCVEVKHYVNQNIILGYAIVHMVYKEIHWLSVSMWDVGKTKTVPQVNDVISPVANVFNCVLAQLAPRVLIVKRITIKKFAHAHHLKKEMVMCSAPAVSSFLYFFHMFGLNINAYL